MRDSVFLFRISGILLLISALSVQGQVLTRARHVPISTDSLSAYKMPYIPVTDKGQNCVWDFSDMPMDSAEHISLDYFLPSADTARIGLHREHCLYYHRIAQDTLWMTGFENSHMHMRYTYPVPMVRFPMGYGDSVCSTFAGNGTYCHLVPFSVQGTHTVQADATGRLILPDMKVDSVIRLTSVTAYQDTAQRHYAIRERRHQWYSPYCRYPLLETTQIEMVKGADTTILASSYYIPQEIAEPERQEANLSESRNTETDSLVTDVSYMPNPVYTDVQIHYTLARNAQVYISLHYNGGVTTYQTPVRQEEQGAHTVSVNMSGMPIGSYVVYIHADDIVVSGNIIKL